MKMRITNPTRVQIRVLEATYDNKQFKITKGKTKSMTVYDASLEEVWQVIKQAIENECNKVKNEV